MITDSITGKEVNPISALLISKIVDSNFNDVVVKINSTHPYETYSTNEVNSTLIKFSNMAARDFYNYGFMIDNNKHSTKLTFVEHFLRRLMLEIEFPPGLINDSDKIEKIKKLVKKYIPFYKPISSAITED